MNDNEKLQEQKKKLESIQLKFKQLLADGKTQDAIQAMKEMLIISNDMLETANQTLRRILGKEKTKPVESKGTMAHNVFPYYDTKYIH